MMHLVYFGSMTLACFIGAKKHIPCVLIRVVRDDNDHLLVGQRQCLEMTDHSSGPVLDGIICSEVKWD